jgi:predicted dehydrogenase/threonine dehydrogenase-like Zn-dependent dehydrogenase
MKQLFQDPKAGTIQVVDIPEPALRPGTLLVRNVRSVISPGTERAAVQTARSSYLKTARNRPDLVRKVMDSVKREGLLAAYRKVQTKLSEPQALGYSSAGVVLAVGPGAGDHFRAGDRVACAGAGIASHAAVICVPVNLAARIPDGVPFDTAAFATLGAIALHGVRQLEPTLGERFGVIGLGILGLMSVQLLRANGARVAGFDLAPDLVERAKALGAEIAAVGSTDDQVQMALAWTDGLGVDGAIVTAASPSDAPMVAAAGMCRERGRVVAVGLVPFGLPREIAYAKEIDLRIARSYGPGRYDANFEEKGIDYPVGYVRWTETRNLEAFLQCLAAGQVELASVITHRYSLDDAPGAYDELVSQGGPRPLGMVIEYAEPAAAAAAPRPAPAVSTKPAAAGPIAGDIGVGFIGAGAFARSVLLPAFKGRSGVKLRRVVDAVGLTAYDAQRKFGFEAIGTDVEEALADPGIHLLCVVTRHDQHAPMVVRGLRAGKNVFVEKPLALTEEQLREVEEAAAASPGLLLVGFNRRFSPMALAIRDALSGRGPLLMTYRVNAGQLPPGHWTTDPEVGGGRIIGEGCHFIDLMSYLTRDAAIVSVQAACAGRPTGLTEDAAIQLAFADGSVGQILYTAKGEPSIGKERLEVHAGGASAVLEDYRTCAIHKGRKVSRIREGGKGHGEEVAALLDAVRRGGPSPIAPATLFGITRATFEVHRSLAASAGPR